MKVCILTTAFPRWDGDNRGPFIFEAAKALYRKGIQVRVVAMHNPGSKVQEYLDGIEVIRPRYLPEQLEILQKEGGGLPEVWRTYPFAKFAMFPFLVAHSLAVTRYSRDCDLIHANWTLSGAVAWWTKWIHQKPYIVTVQGSDIFKASRMPGVKTITKLCLQQSRQVIALSRSLAEHTVRLGIDSSRVQIIPNGVDVDWFHPIPPDQREPIILFVGSLIERKGARYLIKAMPSILEKQPGYRLVIVGEGPEEGELTKLVDQLGIRASVNFVGGQTQDQVRRWMQKAKVFVLPSLEEGLGVVLLEALACGTPIVATKVGGIIDVVSPEVGVMIEPKSDDHISSAVIELLINEVVWNEMSKNARERANTYYDWEVIASQIIEIYKRTIQ